MHGLQECLFKYITVAAFRVYLSVVKMSLKVEVGGHALKSHGNYIVDHGKSWNNHGIVFLNLCGNPVLGWPRLSIHLLLTYEISTNISSTGSIELIFKAL